MKISGLSAFFIAIGLLTLAILPAAGLAKDLAAELDESVAMLGATFPEGDVSAFNATLEEAPDGVNGNTIGLLLYSRGQFGRAAWFYGKQALANPEDAAALNNYAGLIAELHAQNPDSFPAGLLTGARLAAEKARDLAPDTAAMHNTLGNVALAQSDHPAAIAAATRATELAGDEPLYWTNIARALYAAGQPDEAAEALLRAHELAPNDMALLNAVSDLGDSQEIYREELARTCNVDFHCQEICPKSIIGGIQSVTCEMENASAQMACQAGEPYPVAYDCSEDFPEYGIYIPGLNAGFSVSVPGFSAHVRVNGDGSVETRVEAGINRGPLSVYLRQDASYGPKKGLSFGESAAGWRINLGPNKSAANKIASDLGHPPFHIEGEKVSDQPAQTSAEAFNRALVSF